MWKTDDKFRTIRAACRQLNDLVAPSGVEPTGLVMVLRPDVGSYTRSDLGVLRDLVREATSDIFLLPASKAGDYARKEMILIGETTALVMDSRSGSATKAHAEMQEITDRDVTMNLRRRMEEIESIAQPIKLRGRMVTRFLALKLRTPWGVKSILRQVMQTA
jgi:hypothetical protein